MENKTKKYICIDELSYGEAYREPNKYEVSFDKSDIVELPTPAEYERLKAGLESETRWAKHYCDEMQKLQADLKAVREMRDRLVKDGHNCNTSPIFMDEFILTMRKAEAQQAAEKKGGE